MGAFGGIGEKMLLKMGWSEGTGLGAKRDGDVEPVGVSKRAKNLGIGAEAKPFEDPWWDKLMEDAYGKPVSSAGEEDLLKACEGRRCRPHGSAKLARLEAHDNQAVPVRCDGDDCKRSEKRSKKEKRTRKKEKILGNVREGRVQKKKKTRRKEKKEKPKKAYKEVKVVKKEESSPK